MNNARTRSPNYIRHLLALALVLLLAGCQMPPPAPQSSTDTAKIDRLLVLIDQRLDVAPMVAQAKWNSGAPISAPEREAQILQQVAAEAAAAGVDPAFAHDFFQTQFEASKEFQERQHAQWRSEGQPPFAPAPDLARDVRPLLDALTPQLIAALRDVQPFIANEDAVAYIHEVAPGIVRGDFNGNPRAIALAPLTGQ